VARYWSYTAERPHKKADYFSLQVGAGVARFLSLAGRLSGRVLDYGCGPGHLLDHLLSGPVEAWGVDLSLAAVEAANRGLAGRPGWRGATVGAALPTGFPAGSFDLVTCIEAVEHMPEDTLHQLFDECRRLLVPGGALLVTTPNAEDLEQSMVYCPFCEAEFHAWQHLRRLTAGELTMLAVQHGLAPDFCMGLDLWRFVPAAAIGPRASLQQVGRRAAALLDAMAPRPFPQGRLFRAMVRPGPHLCLLATRA
jgi:SAM-dependent methyltransferase